jgi:DNA-binding CsgD family transcriptional regulator
VTTGLCGVAVELNQASCRARPLEVQGRFEAISQAATPEGLADAIVVAAECIGFPFAQAMLCVPAADPAPLVMKERSARVMKFDRAVIVGSDLAVAHPDLGDPTMPRFRQSPLPVVWNGSAYIDAGLGDVRNRWARNHSDNGISMQVPLSADEFSRPLAVVVSVRRREAIRTEDQTRMSADVALLAMHAAVGSERALVPLLLSARHAVSPLTPAMRHYLMWAERGKTARETADIVGRKYSTVKNVLAQAIERMKCSSKAEAVRLARANGWL